MTDVIPIYHGQDFYVPHFDVKVGSRALPKDVVRDVLQVTYKDNIEEIDKFDITINNWDADRRDFKYSDCHMDLFDPGKEVELYMGYYGRDRLRLMITGTITDLQPTFPADGQPKLVISGLNVMHRLRIDHVSQTYEKMTDSEIARQIGGRLKVPVRVDPEAAMQEERHKYLFQDNRYDIIFLMERARQIGYDLFVMEEESGESALYFGPSVNIRQVIYKLTYGRSLIQFQPTLTTANQVGKVTVRGWDAEKKTKIEKTVTRDQIKTRGVGVRGGQANIEKSFAEREEIITNRPVHSPTEAETLARETLERIAKDMVKGSGSTVGLPDLRAGSVVQIEKVGERFSGCYFVTFTTHTIGDSGYTTQFECRREETKEG